MDLKKAKVEEATGSQSFLIIGLQHTGAPAYRCGHIHFCLSLYLSQA